MADWLTREQIDQVIAGMSAADLIEGMGDAEKIQGPKMAGRAFDSAAKRMEHGDNASARVRMSDFAYMAGEISKAVNSESPLSEGQED